MRLRPVLVATVGIALALALLALIAPRVARFIEIFGAHAGPALTQEEVEAAYNNRSSSPGGGGGGGGDGGREYVPKIIHQIFHNWKHPGNDTLPADWDNMRQTCIKANPDFDYRLWTEVSSLEFIANNYPWFLATYEGYKYPVQRVDALKYFLMLKFGGIYLDLDNGCSRDLRPLLGYPAWVTDGARGALSNNILASRPGHPYWQLMTDSLVPWDHNYLFPLVTIHYASGQWFETAIWQKYHRARDRQTSRAAVHGKDDKAKEKGAGKAQAGAAKADADPDPDPDPDAAYRIMMDGRPGAPRWVFFTQGRGGTWDGWDKGMFDYIGNVLIPWLGAHVLFLGPGVAGLVAAGICYRRWRRRRAATGSGYRTLPTEMV